MKRKVIIITIIVILINFYASLAAAADGFTPWDFSKETIKNRPSRKELSLPASIVRGSVIFFSKYISPVDGDRCPMYPTCAAYSRLAIEKHGFLLGTLLTVDRLIHEGNEMDTAPLIKVGDRLRFFDPIDNNDFWWHN